MTKRVIATALWFYTGWYAGALFAQVAGLNPVLGLILGTAVAAIVGVDPRNLIWNPTPRTETSPRRSHSAAARTSI